MSLFPRWSTKLAKPFNRASDFFSLSKFLEEFENDMTPMALSHSGLSISSDDKHIFVEAHVPGLVAKDVNVTVDSDNMLWIKGEKKVDEEDKKRKFYRHSRSSFSYCIPLWEEIDINVEPQAVCEDGVMKITFTKRKQKRETAKKIQIKVKGKSK